MRSSNTWSEVSQDVLRLPELLLHFMAIPVTLVITVAFGYWIGTADIPLVYWSTIAILTSIVIAGLRQRAWIMIFLGWSLTGRVAFLPYSLCLRDVFVVLAAIAYMAYYVIGKRRPRSRWTAVDWILVTNLAWLLIVYLRHPIGLRAFGSGIIGGRSFVNIALATACYWVVSRLPDSPKLVSRIPLMMLTGISLTMLLYLIALVVPAVAGRLGLLYAVFSLDSYYSAQDVLTGGREIQRLGTGVFGIVLIQCLCAYYLPTTLFIPVRWRSLGFWVGVLGVFLSGFRNMLLVVFAYLSLGSALRRHWHQLVLTICLGTFLFGGLTLGQGRFYTLPLGIQRTLSWLPGQWDARIREEAKISNRRFEWWKEVLGSRIIRNWWLGDGMGVSQYDYNVMVSATSAGDFETWANATGAFHNGPLSAIRMVGIVGLVLYYALMIGMVVYAVRSLKMVQGTSLYSLAMFAALMICWQPIHFTFVYGAYDHDISETIMVLGILWLVRRMAEATPQTPTNKSVNQVASSTSSSWPEARLPLQPVARV